MRCQDNRSTKTYTVAAGGEVTADLADARVLRFERQDGAMTGTPDFTVEDGKLAMRFTDGASVLLASS